MQLLRPGFDKGRKSAFRVQAAGPEFEVFEACHLTVDQLEAWRRLQESNPDLASPCFSPEFTQCVAAVRPVEVCAISRNGEYAGFFPFQRSGRTRAEPVGGLTSDYQGIICGPRFSCGPEDLLRACRLAAWDFDRLIATQRFFIPYHKLCERSARIDLSEGYPAYVENRRAAGTNQIRQCEYLMRRMTRDCGPLRFVPHSANPDDLEQVLEWKSQQYRRSGWKDLFATRWGRELVRRVHETQTPGFAGMLSLLYAGDRLVAGHMGMRSRKAWNYWFPAYDREFRRYSPGLILLLKMIAEAADIGMSSIDLGTGVSLYKRRLMNASIDVAEGSVERPSGLKLVRDCRRSASALLRRFWPRPRGF